jgi:hypothetical protein
LVQSAHHIAAVARGGNHRLLLFFLPRRRPPESSNPNSGSPFTSRQPSQQHVESRGAPIVAAVLEAALRGVRRRILDR